MNKCAGRISYYFIVSLFFLSLALPAQAKAENKELTIVDIGAAEIEYNVQTYKSSTKSLVAQNDYDSYRIEHQKKLMAIVESAYFIQQVITVLIFIIVTILALGGLWLSYLQFKNDIRRSQTSTDEKQKASFKIGKDGIEFGSSVIGLIILFISFFFFHLYVKDVYTIHVDKVEQLNLSKKNAVDEQKNK